MRLYQRPTEVSSRILALFLFAAFIRAISAQLPYFADFESTPGPEWSSSQIEASEAYPFTRFSGRFSNDAQTLTLSGLVPGRACTLSFDLYVLDSWDGNAGDFFNITVDGTD